MSTPLAPPETKREVLRYLGPGLILAGSVVGSGELILTTRTGAEAGFTLLWLILLGCVIKVFTQVEICRHCITHNQTTVSALKSIPVFGPIVAWFWFLGFIPGLGQLGGIVGGVGQALELTFPIFGEDSDKWWAILITAFTVMLLLKGTFRFIEVFCTVLVSSFTVLTILNLCALQTQPDWALQPANLLEGLSFGLPESSGAIITALATFGIIGIGGNELVAYPYWCLEKGYGRYIGPKEKAASRAEWLERAKGWIRVLRWDAWASMVVYTLSTVAFYLLGASILHRARLVPEKSKVIATLVEIYEPVFGASGRIILLAGAFAVLFSTFFVSNATKSRLITDALHVFRIRRLKKEGDREKSVRFFGAFFPILCVVIYCLYPKPALLILISGLMQAMLVPVLGIAALWFRWKTCEPELRPSRLWDALLLLSVISFFVVGAYIGWTKGRAIIELFAGNF